MRTSYQPLFKVEISYDGQRDLGAREYQSLSPKEKERVDRAYSVHDLLTIEPTPATARSLQNQKIRVLSDSLGFSLFVAVKTDGSDDTPEFPIDPDATFDFTLRHKTPTSLILANLDLNADPSESYIFSNLSGGVSNGDLQLTRPVPAFDPNSTYASGDIVVSDENDPEALLEAIADCSPSATPDPTKWIQLPFALFAPGTEYAIADRVLHQGICYEAKESGALAAPPNATWKAIYTPRLNNGVHAGDRAPLVPSRFSLPLATSDLTFARMVVKDSEGHVLIEKTLYHETEEPLSEIALDLRHLTFGPFTVDVATTKGESIPGFPKTFYINEESSRPRPFALTRIANTSGSHAFLNPEGKLLNPTYHIRFRKRHTYWRYIFHGAVEDFPPDDTGGLVQANPGDPTTFVTPLPRPLTFGASAFGEFDNRYHLPNPEPTSVIAEDGKLYSNVYIAI